MHSQDAKSNENEVPENEVTHSLISDYPFKLQWVFGFDCTIPPINISSVGIKGVYFTSGSIGVCYDWKKKSQTMLIGHVGSIVSTTSSSDRSYIASVDSGCDASLIIWHRTGKAIFTVNGYFCQKTAVWMCFSEDGNKLLTLTEEKPQELAIWDWKTKKQLPCVIHKFKVDDEFQHYAAFHTKSSSHIISCSKTDVSFFKLVQLPQISLKTPVEEEFIYSTLNVLSLYEKKACKKIGEFTQAVFSPLSFLAYTATTKGMIVIWGMSHYRKDKSSSFGESSFLEPCERTCLRTIQVVESRNSISHLGIFRDFLVVGTDDSEVCWLDESFKLVWSIKVMEGPVSTVSFNIQPRFTFKQIVFRIMGIDIDVDSLKKPDFIVCTKTGYIGYVTYSASAITPIFHGTPNLVKGLAVHPNWSFLYMADNCGTLMKWDFRKKELLSKDDVFQTDYNKIECLTIDRNGLYIACGLGTCGIAIFEAITFSGKAVYIGEDVQYKSKFIKFSPDPQHLIVIDESAYVSWFQLHLLVPPEIFQMLKKKNIPSEEPLWSFKAKTRQHQGHILDYMFSNLGESESLFLFTLGEDRYVIQYNITNSKNGYIEVTKRINLTWNSSPLCMCWYSVYDLNMCFAVISDDEKMCIYDVKTEKLLKMVVMPQYNDGYKKIQLLEEPHAYEDSVQCLAFITNHLIGLSKYPIDGNPFSSRAVKTHPNGVNTFAIDDDEKFLFTTGMNDSWVHMYKIDSSVLIRKEMGIDDFKCLFPINEDADEMKRRLLLSIYSLELEMKLLMLGDTEPILTGEIPPSFIEYVFSALGCFMQREDLEMMMRHIKLEFAYHGTKDTLDALDIIKYYINYRPKEPITMKAIREAFNEVALDESTDSVPRARFIALMETGDDAISRSELFDIITCLREKKPKHDSTKRNNPKPEETSLEDSSNQIYPSVEDLLPDPITEEVFMQDILCFENVPENLSSYILKKTDRMLFQERPKVEDFVIAIKNNLVLKE